MWMLGEHKMGREIGKQGNAKHKPFEWVQCPDCKLERWVAIETFNTSHYTGRCRSCSSKNTVRFFHGEAHPRWKGGKHTDNKGYVVVTVSKNDPYYSMTGHARGYAREHRLIMARHLGRALKPTEHVHHLNGIKDDNRIENLFISKNGEHIKEHHKVIQELRTLRGYVIELESENLRLRKENTACLISKGGIK